MENLEKKLNNVIDLINNENFIEAQKILNEILEVEPKNTEALKNLGLCEVNLDNPPEAIKAFSKVIEIDNQDATSLFYLASCYSRIGEKELAIENFEKVITLRPNYLEAYKSLGMIFIEFKQADNCINIMESILSNEEIEKDYTSYYILATAYLLKKDNLNAIKNLEMALKYNPQHVQLMNSLAVCCLNAGFTNKAKINLEKAYELDENNSLTCYNLGIYHQTIQDFKNALKYLQKSYQLEPSITMMSTLADCATKAGELQLANTLYSNLVAAYPNHNDFRLSYAQILEDLQKYKEALEQIKILLSYDEKNITLIKKKATLLRKLGFNEESISTFETLLKRGKIDVEVYYNLAFNYVDTQDFDKAKEMFKKCITLEPNNPYAHKDLGVLYLKMNCYEWALDEITTAIELEDDISEFYYALGVTKMMLAQKAEAKIALKKAIELDNYNVDALAYLGYLYLTENEKEKAFDTLQKAIKIDANNFLAKNHLAKYYFADKKYDIAKQLLIDITQTNKDDETMNMLGICYINTHEFENGAGVFSKLLPKYPKNHILLTNLANCEIKINKINEAKEHLRQALMIYDDYQEALDLLKEIN